MKKYFNTLINLFSLLIFTSLFFNSCTPEETITKALVETSEVTFITEATATCGGIIASDGGAIVEGRGVCWSISPNPTIEDNITSDAAGTGIFTSTITGLAPGTTYYARAYATNKAGTGYGLHVTFKTKSFALSTTPISFITANSAISGGTISSDGDSVTVIARGVCWNTFPSPTITNSKTTDGVGAGSFTSVITELTPFTTYFVRAYATNSIGTMYGNEVSFTTQSGIIGLTTSTISAITAYTATSGGSITSDGGVPVTQCGICWNTSPSPTATVLGKSTSSGSGTGTFTANITGLVPGITYYVRAYAINSVGTAYGNEVSFTTLALKGTVTDVEGNVYNFITIGSRVWMVENLKTTKYNDGTSIPFVTDKSAWGALSTPGYCYYNNDAANKSTYGALYNWYTVNTGKLAPTGWHVPTDAEWSALTAYLTNNGYGYGGSGGDIAKSMASTSGWDLCSTVGTVGNNQASNNSSGFAGLPGGCRDHSAFGGIFESIGTNGYWWSSTEYSTNVARGRSLGYSSSDVKGTPFDSQPYYMAVCGFSVRCVKD